MSLRKMTSIFLATILLVSCGSNESSNLADVKKAGAQFGRSIAKTDPVLTYKVSEKRFEFVASMTCSGINQRPSLQSDGSALGAIESSVIDGAMQRYTEVEERTAFTDACKEALGYAPVDTSGN
jgi:hypothetical protein